MKTFMEFLQMKEGGMWQNPGLPGNNGRGLKRQGLAWEKDLYNSEYGQGGGAGVGGGMGNVPTGQQIPPKKMKKRMKKK